MTPTPSAVFPQAPAPQSDSDSSESNLTSQERDDLQTALPGYLFIAMDDDHCANLTFCADEAAVRDAVQEAMLWTPEGERPSAEDLEMVRINADELLENETLKFEGDAPLHLYKLHDGADVIAQAERQAFFLAQERDRALAASEARVEPVGPASSEPARSDGTSNPPASMPLALAPSEAMEVLRELVEATRDRYFDANDRRELAWDRARTLVSAQEGEAQ